MSNFIINSFEYIYSIFAFIFIPYLKLLLLFRPILLIKQIPKMGVTPFSSIVVHIVSIHTTEESLAINSSPNYDPIIIISFAMANHAKKKKYLFLWFLNTYKLFRVKSINRWIDLISIKGNGSCIIGPYRAKDEWNSVGKK